jgi:UDP-galactopyranose mutase
MNFTQTDVACTRIHEDKHFAPWERHDRTVGLIEFSKETEADDIPYYPKRLVADKERLDRYVEMALAEKGVSFLGRLATYRYMDMHQVIAESLEFCDSWLAARRNHLPLPVFPSPFKI